MSKYTVGSVFETNNFGKVEVLKYRGCRSIDIRFLNTGTVVTTTSSRLCDGGVRDRYAATVYGRGFIGEERTKVKGKTLPAYLAWSNMMTRCYNPKYHERFPTYRGCKVSKDWFSFKTFKGWWEGNHVEGYELDKDLLGDGKLYSEQTCAYIPAPLNMLLVSNYRQRGDCVLGVTLQNSGYYHAQVNKGNGTVSLGLFTSEIAAQEAYVNGKRLYTNSLLFSLYGEGKISSRVWRSVVEKDFMEEETGVKF